METHLRDFRELLYLHSSFKELRSPHPQAYKENYTSPFEPGKGHDVHTVYRGEPVTVQGFIDRLNSKSYIAALSEDDRTELENNIRTIVEDEKDKSVKWVDREQGVLEQPFQTDLYLFKRV